jgi:peptide deformylase
MVLPIYAYGHPVLKKKCENISTEYPGLESLIANMWNTMYHAHGVGLAAPQIGLAIRLFVVDTIQIMEDDKKDQGIKKVFINAQILDESGNAWSYEEGCLSIPNVRGDVERNPKITIQYLDENFQEHTEEYDEFNARVIQHEYDHIEGILFVEKLNPLKRRLVGRKLDNIRRGKVKAEYNMKFV